jgi:hypothetical protein
MKIHGTIGVAQEGMHIRKKKSISHGIEIRPLQAL